MTVAREFFAGLYQEAPKPVLVFTATEQLVYANESAAVFAAQLRFQDPSAFMQTAVWREARRCLQYERGASVSVKIAEQQVILLLTPYFYKTECYLVVTVEREAVTPEQQALLQVLRNSRGKMNGYLNSIYGVAQQLGLDTKDGKELGAGVRRILRMADHLDRLLDRQEAYDYLVPADAGRFTAVCVQNINDIQPAAQVIMAPFEVEQFARIHPESLELILGMLVDNALRFCNSKVMVSVTQKEDRIYITVKDDGAGVADPNQLFSWGYRTPDKKGSIGLGYSLALAKMLAERQGAALLYERADNVTCFHVVLKAEELPQDSRLAEWNPEPLENSLSQMRIELSDYMPDME